MQTVRFHGQNLVIGSFECAPDNPRFADSGPTGGHLLVFPRTSVCITHAGGKPTLADPSVVMFYNHGQEYRRAKLSERGDICDWFGFNPATVRDAVALYDPAARDRAVDLFRFSHGPSDPGSYLLQRLITEQLTQPASPDRLFIEELALSVLGRALNDAYHAWGAGPHQRAPEASRAAKELVHAVKQLLADTFRERMTLDQIARLVYSSPFYLCRCFQQTTGLTIHQYLTQLRLRASLEYIAEANTGLTALGLELGFASHSHFTQAFRAAFGIVPSALRRSVSPQRLRELSKILIV